MYQTIDIKTPQTEFGVSEFITSRFSPRAFSDEEIDTETMYRLFEAASWAPSANNEQPWEYYFALRGAPGFDKIWETLMPGNQPWAKQAAALVISVARKTFSRNGNPNVAALHDLGMANATLLLQARALDIFGHPIGGFDKEKVAALIGLDEDRVPAVVFALGYLGDAESLEEPYKSRETTPRTRKAVSEFVTSI